MSLYITSLPNPLSTGERGLISTITSVHLTVLFSGLTQCVIYRDAVPSPVERARERFADLPLSLTLSPRARGD